MTTAIVQTLVAIIGTLGFCLFIRLRLSRLPVIAVSTAVCFLTYLAALHFGVSEFTANAVAAMVTALLSEICAVWLKAPVTVFLIPSLLPLIPGAHLYYAIEGFFKNDPMQGLSHLTTLLQAIGGLVLGITVVSAIFRTVRTNRPPKKN